MVFSNMPSFLSRDEWVSSVIEIVESSLRDDRVEVRDKSGKILSGLLHCQFIRGDRKTKLMVRSGSTLQPACHFPELRLPQIQNSSLLLSLITKRSNKLSQGGWKPTYLTSSNIRMDIRKSR
jgi:hypothetical protein